MTTGFMPSAIAKPIAPGTNDPTIKPVGVVLHTAVSKSSSLFDFFRSRSGGIESHFYVREDGQVEQYRSIFREADAQLDGNSFTLDGKLCGFVSVETEGLGSEPWTANQIAAIKKILLWVQSQAAFPWRVCPAWNRAGVGYHTMWGSPSHWTPVAKTCPGPKRVQQFHTGIKPWIERQAVAAAPAKPAAEDSRITRIRNLWMNDRIVDVKLMQEVRASGKQPEATSIAKATPAIEVIMQTYFEETD